MQAIRLLIAAATLCTAGFTQASEITDFPVPAASSVSRDSVRGEAIAANNVKRPRLDASGPAVTPMSSRTREEVRAEAAALQHDQRGMMAWMFVGGM